MNDDDGGGNSTDDSVSVVDGARRRHGGADPPTWTTGDGWERAIRTQRDPANARPDAQGDR